jgi:hypothetical protein
MALAPQSIGDDVSSFSLGEVVDCLLRSGERGLLAGEFSVRMISVMLPAPNAFVTKNGDLYTAVDCLDVGHCSFSSVSKHCETVDDGSLVVQISEPSLSVREGASTIRERAYGRTIEIVDAVEPIAFTVVHGDDVVMWRGWRRGAFCGIWCAHSGVSSCLALDRGTAAVRRPCRFLSTPFKQYMKPGFESFEYWFTIWH